MKITLSLDADHFLQSIPDCLCKYLVTVIRTKALVASEQMIVIGWTESMPDHIYRCMKDYKYKPGIRAIFHMTRYGLHIDTINWRDCDPYQDGK